MILNYFEIFNSLKTTITIIASLVLIKYFIYLVFAPFYNVQKRVWELKKKIMIKKGIISAEYRPLVSIIVPAWNEEVGIITTVKSALANTYNNLEIIIVNDGSTDNTDGVVKEFLKEYKASGEKDKKVVYYAKENGGKGTALNYGIKKAHGDIIVTMDADSAHEPHAMERLVKYFQNPEIQAVVGNVKVKNTSTLVGLLQHVEYLFGFYFKRVHSLFDAEYIFGGACAAFRKSTTFDQIGLFDTLNKTEDIEYSMRVKLNGLKSAYAEDVITYTEGASDFKGLYKQRLRWKKGRIDTFVKYRHLFCSRDDRHSKFLSWVVLPYAVLGEFQMIMEPLFFTAIWTYTFVSGDYLSAGISSLFIFFTYLSATVFGDRETNKLYVLLFPATWLMFYLLVGVEFFALLKSIELIRANQDVVWQSWARQGIKEDLKYIESDLNSRSAKA